MTQLVYVHVGVHSGLLVHISQCTKFQKTEEVLVRGLAKLVDMHTHRHQTQLPKFEVGPR